VSACLVLSTRKPDSSEYTELSEKTSSPAPLPASSTPGLSPALEARSWWQPGIGSTFEWVLSESPQNFYAVGVYDIDLFDNDASMVRALHDRGIKVICYLSAGSFEDWRPDAPQFPPEVIGKDYAGWAGERWLDTRAPAVRRIMAGRLDQCAARGFDGVEPDNMWADEDTGFPLTEADTLDYAHWLATQAHGRGLSIGQKNAPELALDLVETFDWALVEQCFVYGFCDRFSPYIEVGKAVFSVEYTDQTPLEKFEKLVCPEAARLKFTAILKRPDLDSYREACDWP
jgi:hypothetical protein